MKSIKSKQKLPVVSGPSTIPLISIGTSLALATSRVEEEADEADITSDDETESPSSKNFNVMGGLPRTCVRALTEDLVEPKPCGDNLASLEYDSTNGSICPEPSLGPDREREKLETPTEPVEELRLSSGVPAPVRLEVLDPAAKPETRPSVLHAEDVPDTFVVVVHKNTHDNLVDGPISRLLALRNKEQTEEKIRAIETGKEWRAVNDFREGTLEKKGSGLLGSWKEKHCRVGHSQYIVFKNVQTGLLSELIDFRRTQTVLSSDPAGRTFTYFLRISFSSS